MEEAGEGTSSLRDDSSEVHSTGIACLLARVLELARSYAEVTLYSLSIDQPHCCDSKTTSSHSYSTMPWKW